MDSAIEQKKESSIVYLFNALTISTHKLSKSNPKKKLTFDKVPLKKAQWSKPLLNIDEIITSFINAAATEGYKQIEQAHVLLSHILNAIEINPTHAHYDLLSKTYNMLGAAHGQLKDWDKQIIYCHKAKIVANNIHDKNRRHYLQARALINITLAINNQKTDNFELIGFEQAIDMLESICKPNNSVYYLLLFAYEQILNVYNQSGHLRNAKTEDIPYKALFIFSRIQFPDERIMKMRDLFIQYFPNANFAFSKKRNSDEFFTGNDKKKMKIEETEYPDSPIPLSLPS